MDWRSQKNFTVAVDGDRLKRRPNLLEAGLVVFKGGGIVLQYFRQEYAQSYLHSLPNADRDVLHTAR